ncbi:MAG: nicotinate (nicotinamide) nucleotide adenylyltransferase [Candidatus Brocadiaceae bacterium]|nr:nicotinate (nicotinamide) nucleotide adenylyltransferase [Candidatus Brocadiaceae bacterium]
MAGIGLLGGSFDPVHCAHVALAERARDRLALDCVRLVPARRNPHKPVRPVASDAHRVRMLELAVEGRRGLRVSTAELDRQGPSYTLITVQELRREVGVDAPIYLLLGADSVGDLARWWRADELVAQALVVPFDRPGCRLDEVLEGLVPRFGRAWVAAARARRIDGPPMEVSSTQVRERLRAGLSVVGLVPEAVARYIAEQGLYA